MILILYTHFHSYLGKYSLFQKLLRKIPENLHVRILHYHKEEDRWASLLGKVLLQEGLKGFEITKNYKLTGLRYTLFRRPYLDFADLDFDFNISHSRTCVCCALNLNSRIGLDIEYMQSISLERFLNQMTEQERRKIDQANNQLQAFYNYWTEKEAIIKANGKGLYINMNEIEVNNRRSILENQIWQTFPINIGEGYTGHIATLFPVEFQNLKILNMEWDK